MGDANDLNYDNVSPEKSKVLVISESDKLKEFPSEVFVGKLESLVGENTISYKRIIKLTHDSLREVGKTSGDITEYFSLVEGAIDIAQRYFSAIDYSENSRGYVRQK